MSSILHDEEALSLLCDIPPEKDRALLHLLTCPACREWATHRLLQEQGVGKVLPEYDEVFARLHRRLPSMIEEAARRRAETETLLNEVVRELLGQPAKVVEDPRLHPADLLEASLEAQPGDPERSEALAKLAVELTVRLFREEPDETVGALYFTRASVLQGNLHRLRGKLKEAEEALERGSFFLAWPFDSWDRAAFCRTLGLVRWEQGRLDEAAALLRQSARLFSEQYLLEEEGASQVLVGLLCLEQNQTEMAIRLLQTGRAALDAEARPWLTVRAGLSLALALAEIGQVNRAAGVLADTRWHYVQVREEREEVRIYWLEGKICARLGKREEAEHLLAAVRCQLMAEHNLAETVLCSLDLAAVLVELGRSAELPQLLQDVEETFKEDESGLEATRRVSRAFATEIAGRREVPPDDLAAVASTLRRVFRMRGFRVESLPFA